MPVDYFHDEVALLHELRHVHPFHLRMLRLLELFLAHHALADGRHLRTMVGIDDGGDDVAAEGRTNLIEQVLVRPAALGIGMVAYDEARTVGREPAAQRGGDARSEVAPHRRRTEQGYLGFLLFEDTANHRRMGQGAVRSELRIVRQPERIGSVASDNLIHLLEFVTEGERFQFAPEAVGQFAAFGEQLQADISHLAAFRFNIYEYVVHLTFLLYPSVWLEISSTISESISPSEAVSLRDSLAWNTTFSICFTLVGEPSSPSCWGSASISPTFHSLIFR